MLLVCYTRLCYFTLLYYTRMRSTKGVEQFISIRKERVLHIKTSDKRPYNRYSSENDYDICRFRNVNNS